MTEIPDSFPTRYMQKSGTTSLTDVNLAWYHALPDFDKTPWWLTEDGRKRAALMPARLDDLELNKENKTLFPFPELSEIGRPLLASAPIVWEIMRRHPALSKLRLRFPSPLSINRPETTEEISKNDALDRVAAELEKPRLAWNGMPSRSLRILLINGNVRWPKLNKYLRRTFEEDCNSGFEFKNAKGENRRLPGRGFMIDRLREKFRAAAFGNVPQAAERGIRKFAVGKIENQVKSLGHEMMVLQFDPNSSIKLLCQAFGELLSKHFPKIPEGTVNSTNQNLLLTVLTQLAAALQPKVVNMKAVSHVYFTAIMSTGGAAK